MTCRYHKKYPPFLLACLVYLFPAELPAQDSTKHKGKLSWMLLADAFYSYSLNDPPGKAKAPFLYHYNRHDRPALNLALARFSYTRNRYKVQAGLMTGTYPADNTKAEPALFRNIFEGSAGWQWNKKRDGWIEAGIFPSHIGFESAISTDNATLSRSLAADNSPYYECGLNLSAKSLSRKWLFRALLLNGWQRIRRAPGNRGRSWGTQVTYTAGDSWLLNWSSFQGNDKADSVRQFRSFHNFYAQCDLSEKWKLTTGLDIGFQEKKQQRGWDNWYTPVLVVQYVPGTSWSLAGRLEYYHDPHNVIVDPVSPSLPFQTFGASFNADWLLKKFCWWRAEYRFLQSHSPVFEKSSGRSRTDQSFTIAIVIKFQG